MKIEGRYCQESKNGVGITREIVTAQVQGDICAELFLRKASMRTSRRMDVRFWTHDKRLCDGRRRRGGVNHNRDVFFHGPC